MLEPRTQSFANTR